MSKRLSIAAYIMLFVLLASCAAKPGSDIPYDCMKDNDTGLLYALGDNKTKFDDAYGECVFDERLDSYTYLDGILAVLFDDNDNACYILAGASSNRFSFHGFDFSMGVGDISGLVVHFETSGYITYEKYFNDNGKECLPDVAFITVGLGVIKASPGGGSVDEIIYYSIRLAEEG